MAAPTVLIVEDDPDTRDMLARFLTFEGFEVEVASNGREALELLSGGRRAAVILLDLMMPVMDGWEFRRRQALDPDLSRIPTIVVSAAGPDRVSQVSADACLVKPVDMDELLERVHQFCSMA